MKDSWVFQFASAFTSLDITRHGAPKTSTYTHETEWEGGKYHLSIARNITLILWIPWKELWELPGIPK